MSEFISGKEALIAMANGEDVEYMDTSNTFKSLGCGDAFGLETNLFFSDRFKFRLKPRTITINGIEVPAPFDGILKHKQYAYVLNTVSPDGYSSIKFYEGGNQPLICWTDEEEIKQVFAALRSVFGKK